MSEIQRYEADWQNGHHVEYGQGICVSYAAHVADKAAAVAEVEQERDKLQGLLSVATCPDCGGSGTVPHSPNADGNWDLEQCRWCYEVKQALAPEPEQEVPGDE